MTRYIIIVIAILLPCISNAQRLKVELLSADTFRYYPEWTIVKFRLRNISDDTLYLGTGYFKERLFCYYTSDSADAYTSDVGNLIMPPNTVYFDPPQFDGCMFREYDPKHAKKRSRFVRHNLKKNKRVKKVQLPDKFDYKVSGVLSQSDSIFYRLMPSKAVSLYRELAISTLGYGVVYTKDIKLMFSLQYKDSKKGAEVHEEMLYMQLPQKVAEIFLELTPIVTPSAP